MQRYKILHRTYYNFSAIVQLGPHALRLRPREGHDLRIESSRLDITPSASLQWHFDVEDNSVAIATFATPANQLVIESEVVVQQFNQAPFDFLLTSSAADYPFAYAAEDSAVLAPYRRAVEPDDDHALAEWVASIWQPDEAIPTFALLQRLSASIHQGFSYQLREEPGVQNAVQTLSYGSGSCRDFAQLFIEAARHLGFAARFVSGYLHTPPTTTDYGSTHAWAEVYLPGVGWKGFDPTVGALAATSHIAVAVARLPESVPPIAGSFVGQSETSLEVGVWVSEL